MIEVRKSEPDSLDIENIFRIRREVFVEEQGVSESEEYDQFESSSVHYLALYSGKPAGCARWRVTPEGKVKLERFAVLLPYRNKGIASALMRNILNDIPKSNTVYLHSQDTALEFYRRFNFSESGPGFMEAGIAHHKMVLEIGV
jgi:predicted GNAT family N-acyltransferase